jgi:hypothetical protein
MTLPCIGRERAALSVTDGCRRRGGDVTTMLFRVPEALVNIAHFQKLNEIGHGLLIERFCGCPTAVAGTGRLWNFSMSPSGAHWSAKLTQISCFHFRCAQDALPAPTPAAAPPASPSTPASKESHDEEQQYRTDGSVDDCADHSRTEMDA